MSDEITPMEDDSETLRAKLNAETGRMDWPALARHFARGVVIRVGPELDLIEVAVGLARDDKSALATWLDAGQVAKASTEDAQAWNDGQAVFWAVVVAPWVLVREIVD